ncbi:hypothetical protein MKZ08_13000 [Viridibacillus sp. FSL R5-0477]|uniref:Uncharacterized protein n=2 Tax=Caryophanaceae TaxID=186818 RepID=W4EJ69_9BACL|nr:MULTISPECIES: hypothetical protein [Viridibacillus]ETT80580.1 hypothetical protein C176_21421 [Viridibacillus arenosi FSL R5-213]OMC77746.1 hypothetical protein BK130_21115 [Viridibacillus sp. FSL H8-0123]OMC82282.1 hypothetical protein BK128_20760 [Viridibacillus sp. FSL H7-0596]OMC87081.1 hypothetical protein BK137_20970 [Viridibacillus arenosi]
MMYIIGLIFGVVLVTWGIYRMKTDEGLFGKNQKNKNLFNLLLMGEASGIGQFLGGVILIIAVIIGFFVK